MLAIRDPDGGSTPESRDVSSTFPRRIVPVLLRCHSLIASYVFRALHHEEKIPKKRCASTLSVIEPAQLPWDVASVHYKFVRSGLLRHADATKLQSLGVKKFWHCVGSATGLVT